MQSYIANRYSIKKENQKQLEAPKPRKSPHIVGDFWLVATSCHQNSASHLRHPHSDRKKIGTNHNLPLSKPV
jgi:hypothetical protein